MGCLITPCLSRFNPRKKTRYSLYRRLAGRRAGLAGCGKFPPLPLSSGFAPRIAQSSARRYTDYTLSQPTATLVMDRKGDGIIEIDWIWGNYSVGIWSGCIHHRKENEVDVWCNDVSWHAWRRRDVHLMLWLENLKETGHIEKLGLDWRSVFYNTVHST